MKRIVFFFLLLLTSISLSAQVSDVVSVNTVAELTEFRTRHEIVFVKELPDGGFFRRFTGGPVVDNKNIFTGPDGTKWMRLDRIVSLSPIFNMNVALDSLSLKTDSAAFNANKLQGKEVDLTGLADLKMLQFNAASQKFVLIDPPAGGGGSNNFPTSFTYSAGSFSLGRSGLSDLTLAFTKSDIGLSNVPNTDATNASNLASGSIPASRFGNVTIPIAAINATGTPSITTVLHGDGVWRAPSGGGAGNPSGATTFIQYNDDGVFGSTANLTYDNITSVLRVNGQIGINVVPTGGTLLWMERSIIGNFAPLAKLVNLTTDGFAMLSFKGGDLADEWTIGGAAQAEAFFGLANKFFIFHPVDNTPWFVLTPTGNIGLGNITSPGARLDIKGSGTTSATHTILAKNSANTTVFDVRNDGGWVIDGGTLFKTTGWSNTGITNLTNLRAPTWNLTTITNTDANFRELMRYVLTLKADLVAKGVFIDDLP
jgi:hypothetical protein